MIPTLNTECNQFLESSNGHPILRNLPSIGLGFRKVKVRQKKRTDAFINSFNEAFYEERKNLLRRAVIAHGISSLNESQVNEEPFYIFPKNNYKFMFCQNPNVTTEMYKNTLDSLIHAVGTESGQTVFHEILQHQYEFSNLEKGITSGAEIILFNIPYYYAIRESLVVDYKKLIYM